MKTLFNKHFDKLITGIAILTVTVCLTGMITILNIDKEIKKEQSKLSQYED